MAGYDTHQRLRTKAVRQLKKKDYDGAIRDLYAGALELLKEDDEQGSACDLAVYMIDVYSQSETKSDEESRARIVEVVRLSRPDFWRKKVIDAAIKWSAKVTGMPAADGHLRLALGQVLAAEGSYHAAEAHLLNASIPPPGNPGAAATYFPAEAPAKLADVLFEWMSTYVKQLQQHGDKRAADMIVRMEVGRWTLRGLLPLLLSRALTSSRVFLSTFVKRLTSAHASLLLPVQPNPKPFSPPANTGPVPPSSQAQDLYMTTSADLNFAQMTLALVGQSVNCKKAGQPVPDALKSQWTALVTQARREGSSALHEEFVDEALAPLSALYFDMKARSGAQGNFMQDMLSSLMGGGGAAAAGGAPAAPAVKQAPPPPAIEGEVQAEESTEEAEELDLD